LGETARREGSPILGRNLFEEGLCRHLRLAPASALELGDDALLRFEVDEFVAALGVDLTEHDLASADSIADIYSAYVKRKVESDLCSGDMPT
jgi:hypothetical protein